MQDFLSNVKVSFMQSDGGLADISQFSGFRAILSGPAGGVVGYSSTSYNAVSKDNRALIGVDACGCSAMPELSMLCRF